MLVNLLSFHALYTQPIVIIFHKHLINNTEKGLRITFIEKKKNCGKEKKFLDSQKLE